MHLEKMKECDCNVNKLAHSIIVFKNRDSSINLIFVLVFLSPLLMPSVPSFELLCDKVKPMNINKNE